MWLKNKQVIKKITVKDEASLKTDPDVTELIKNAPEVLGKNGSSDLKPSETPNIYSIIAEGKNRKLCDKYIKEFEKLLIRKGYMDHEHVWELVEETDYGEMDYNSYGGGVEHFVVTLYRCSLCGEMHKEHRGDFCGDVEEFLKNH